MHIDGPAEIVGWQSGECSVFSVLGWGDSHLGIRINHARIEFEMLHEAASGKFETPGQYIQMESALLDSLGSSTHAPPQ
jgi:hypothetical protein